MPQVNRIGIHTDESQEIGNLRRRESRRRWQNVAPAKRQHQDNSESDVEQGKAYRQHKGAVELHKRRCEEQNGQTEKNMTMARDPGFPGGVKGIEVAEEDAEKKRVESGVGVDINLPVGIPIVYASPGNSGNHPNP